MGPPSAEGSAKRLDFLGLLIGAVLFFRWIKRKIEKFRFEHPVCHEFILSDEQNDSIERYLGVFSETPHGIGRMMAKVFVNKFLRLGAPKSA